MSQDRPTINERYSRANNSSDLTVTPDRRTDADVLIAAGWTPGLLGGVLMRLHSEWDGAAKKLHMDETEAFLLFSQLKTLRRAVDGVAAWAERKGHKEPRTLANAVLIYWLHDNCQPCLGRGHEVIHGSPVLGRQCRKCGGSGKRQAPGGEVGKAALNMMDECVHVARQSMRLRLRNML